MITLPQFSGALCAGIGVENFFQEKPHPTPEQRMARELCASCPCFDECLTWALNHEEYGTWAGTTPPERARMRRELGIELQPIDLGLDL